MYDLMTPDDFRSVCKFVLAVLNNHGGTLPFSYFDGNEALARELGLTNFHWLDIVFGVLEEQGIVTTKIDRTNFSKCGAFFEYTISIADDNRRLDLTDYLSSPFGELVIFCDLWATAGPGYLPMATAREYAD